MIVLRILKTCRPMFGSYFMLQTDLVDDTKPIDAYIHGDKDAML